MDEGEDWRGEAKESDSAGVMGKPAVMDTRRSKVMREVNRFKPLCRLLTEQGEIIL